MGEAGSTRLRELAGLFLKLGTIAFGGPVAHIAMMQHEVVERRRWMSHEELLDLIGAANLVPGPNSTELAIHIGNRRAGAKGLLVAGVCFIVPAMIIVLACAWAYVEFGSTPPAEAILYGVQPVVIAIVANALVGLAPSALKSPGLIALGVVALSLYLLGVGEIVLLFGFGVLYLVARTGVRLGRRNAAAVPWAAAPAIAAGAPDVNLPQLFFVFLKIGAVLYGSGYVLLAFLRTDLIENLGLLTERQLIDAVAIGQVTPGPVFTTATFVGYLLAGLPGALVATLGIFLPSFLFVALTAPLVPRLRDSENFSAFLDGVNAAALALMAGVSLQLARAAIVDPLTIGIALVTLGLLLRTRINSAWLIAAGAAAGGVSALV
jgi:chromate transporter